MNHGIPLLVYDKQVPNPSYLIHVILGGEEVQLFHLHEEVARLGLCVVLHVVGNNDVSLGDQLRPLGIIVLPKGLPLLGDLPGQVPLHKRNNRRLACGLVVSTLG